MSDQNNEPQKPTNKANILQIIGSTLAAAVGVQSNRNRERDFSGNNLAAYVVAGLIFTGVFVAGLIFWVQHLLANS
ncbi:DUF2970 domain-containing protein [uncultured Gilvimarinus sp.]|uniref:DUF2970 domain-containing protein n=1 Tax=uncultured Gilvimarinus sp. TaxID=1689143 RepID=UPI0030EC0A48|tara:strand:+ start:1149 stop:1376 length:228 start_codon:yes stop_codon:yes gene_type:complete